MEKKMIMKIFFILVCLFCFTGWILFFTFHAEGESLPRYKYYKSIEIQTGDSLWSIANEYRTEEYSSVQDYINEVKYINNMKDDHITNGAFLVIPYYSSDLRE